MRSIDPLPLSLSPNPHFAAPFGAAPNKEEAQCHVHFSLVGALKSNLGFASIPAEAFVRVHSVGQGSVRLPCFFSFFFFGRTSTTCRARLPREALPRGARAPRYTSVCLITSQTSVLRFNIPAPARDLVIASSFHEKGTSVSASSICR